ncbi:hypothetical protein DFH09DRAFT_1101024 [Mycena vulgaris]|nr:hypothetical protein DFH09DRAFT_1101024 [Mycena vulgaris]
MIRRLLVLILPPPVVLLLPPPVVLLALAARRARQPITVLHRSYRGRAGGGGTPLDLDAALPARGVRRERGGWGDAAWTGERGGRREREGWHDDAGSDDDKVPDGGRGLLARAGVQVLSARHTSDLCLRSSPSLQDRVSCIEGVRHVWRGWMNRRDLYGRGRWMVHVRSTASRRRRIGGRIWRSNTAGGQTAAGAARCQCQREDTPSHGAWSLLRGRAGSWSTEGGCGYGVRVWGCEAGSVRGLHSPRILTQALFHRSFPLCFLPASTTSAAVPAGSTRCLRRGRAGGCGARSNANAPLRSAWLGAREAVAAVLSPPSAAVDPSPPSPYASSSGWCASDASGRDGSVRLGNRSGRVRGPPDAMSCFLVSTAAAGDAYEYSEAASVTSARPLPILPLLLDV